MHWDLEEEEECSATEVAGAIPPEVVPKLPLPTLRAGRASRRGSWRRCVQKEQQLRTILYDAEPEFEDPIAVEGSPECQRLVKQLRALQSLLTSVDAKGDGA
eukprot:1623195-Amphidinium_carterae.3